MSSRLPVIEASKLRTMVKVIQIFLALPVIVSIRYFKSSTSIKVLCGPEISTPWNMTVSEDSRNSTMTSLLSSIEELNSSGRLERELNSSGRLERELNSSGRLERELNSSIRSSFEKELNSSVRPERNLNSSVRPERNLNSSIRSSFEKELNSSVRPRFETFLNYTIQFPFKSPKVLEPLSCNETSHLYARAVHPSMRVPAMVLTMTVIVSSMYCFIYLFAFSDLESFSRPQIISEIMTSILLTFFWFLSSVSWSSSVAHIKHFGTHFIDFSHLCDDPMARCTETVSGSTYCPLYLSLILCFFNFLTWFIFTSFRIHSTAFLLFPTYFTSTAQAKFSRVKSADHSFHSLNNSQTFNSQTLNSQTFNTPQSIATIEDKIEFQRDDFFQSIKETESQRFRTIGGSINNPNYGPDEFRTIDNPNYGPDDFVSNDGNH